MRRVKATLLPLRKRLVSLLEWEPRLALRLWQAPPALHQKRRAPNWGTNIAATIDRSQSIVAVTPLWA